MENPLLSVIAIRFPSVSTVVVAVNPVSKRTFGSFTSFGILATASVPWLFTV